MKRFSFRHLLDRFQRRADFSALPKPIVPRGSKPPLRRMPRDEIQAANSLYAPDILNTLGFQNRSSKWVGPFPDDDFARFVRSFMHDLHARGFPMFIHTARRSDREQNRLLKAGHSLAPAGQSPHNHGYAVDIVHFGRWWGLSIAEWRLIGLIGKEAARRANVKVRWGGDWDGDGDLMDNRLFDPAHWELDGWALLVRDAPPP